MIKRLMCALLIVLAAITVLGCGGGGNKVKETASGDKLEVKVLNVGQGDAILIRKNGQTVLIDTSDTDERDKFRAELKKAGVTVIDKLIITHPHADHLGGAAVLFKDFKVKAVYDNGVPANPKFYRDYLKSIKQKKIAYKQLTAGEVLEFAPGVTFKVLYPTKEFVANGARDKKGKVDLNGSSIVGRLTFGKFAMMLTGDIEREGETEILKNNHDLKCQVIKAGHHGSKTSSSDKFLKAVGADAVIISCGAGNDYGHPHSQAMKRFQKHNLKVYRTDLNGTVTVTTDGNKYNIKGEK